jgi:hypothetical protein
VRTSQLTSHVAPRSASRVLIGSALVWLGLALTPAAAFDGTESNGTFRFLNDVFPPLSTNGPVFTGQLVVANADGPVTFSVDPGSQAPLPAGLSLDPLSGLITGIPTNSGNENVTFRADDGTQSITREVLLSISSSGGGGNGGSGLSNPVFPDGAVGTLYAHTVTPDGDGPFTFGGSDLPPGLSLDGATGEISGTPSAAGTFFMSLTVHDKAPNEENIGAAIVPIRIFPAGSSFAFVTQFLNNGEVGTPFCDQYVVENPAGSVTFGATGLPPGLALDPATGAVSGTPTEAGTFLVTISADDGSATIAANRSMVIATSALSEFHWNVLGLPAALAGVLYDRMPPIVLSAEGAPAAITYSATGLPGGMSYDASTGELSGTPLKAGEYPASFTAVAGAETLRFDTAFIVLPATGGDVSQITVNLWVKSVKLKLGEDGKESWKVAAIYNADRRTGLRFDPATDAFAAQLGAHAIALEPGSLTGKVPDQDASFKSASGVIPGLAVRVTPDKQACTWSTKSDTIAETVPGDHWQQLILGDDAWRLLLGFDAKGGFKPALAFRRTAFVVATGSLTALEAGSGSAKLGLLLADPNFAYEAGASALRLRLLDGATVLVDRDFTALGGLPKSGVDASTGKPWLAFKTLPDDALADRVSMSYDSRKGTLKLALADADLSAITPAEAHLDVELTIGSRTYTTAVTFFAATPGKYNLAMP